MADLTDANFFFDCVPNDPQDAPLKARRRAKQGVWLDAVGASGWRAACDAAGCSQQDVVRWLRIDPEFAAAYRTVQADIAVRLERIADEIAAGEIDATPSQLSALTFRLRGLRPDMYRDRSTVQVDATTRAADGDGSRARAMLEEWAATKQPPAPATPPNSSAPGT